MGGAIGKTGIADGIMDAGGMLQPGRLMVVR